MRTTLLFNIISLLLDTFSPRICKFLNAVGKESLWLTAKPLSPHHQLQINDLLERSWGVQTDGNLKRPSLGCRQGAWELPSSVAEWCWWWGVLYEGVHCRVTAEHLCQPSSPFWADSRPQLTLIVRRSRTGTVWFYTTTRNKRAARPKLYTKSLTRDLKRMYSRFTLVTISINL